MENLLSLELLYIFTLVLFITVISLGIWTLKITRHYNNLIKNTKKKTLTEALEGIQQTLSQHEKKSISLEKELNQLLADSKLHIQDVRLERFNPFSDTGGDQSFILVLMDSNKDGVVITSLHSRENTRFYVKSISAGKGVNHPLSADEQKVVNKRKR